MMKAYEAIINIMIDKLQLVGWMNGDFTFFSRVFQSYQDDDGVILKGCVLYDIDPHLRLKRFPPHGNRSATARSASKRLTN